MFESIVTALLTALAVVAAVEVLLGLLTAGAMALGLPIAATLSPTNRYMNSSGWGFTPSGGSLTNITGVTNETYDEQISTKKEGADFDLFPTVAVADYRDPIITLETLDAFILMGVVAGASGTLVGTVRDAYNGATTGGGAKLITMSNARIQGRNQSQPYREYGKQSLVFGAVSADGATHPVAITAV
jgi:hypothetical protein